MRLGDERLEPALLTHQQLTPHSETPALRTELAERHLLDAGQVGMGSCRHILHTLAAIDLNPGADSKATPMNEHKKTFLAERQLAAIKGFYIHLAVFVLVMAILVAINFATGPAWWVQWPFLGWGIGVLGHAFAVFGRSPAALARWEQRKIDDLKRRLEQEEAEAQGQTKAPGPIDKGRPSESRAAS